MVFLGVSSEFAETGARKAVLVCTRCQQADNIVGVQRPFSKDDEALQEPSEIIPFSFNLLF